jgi:hypothetical protein
MARLKVSDARIELSWLDWRGRVPVWVRADNRWKWLFPVDAREVVGMGFGQFESPDDDHPRPQPGSPPQRMSDLTSDDEQG